jgi:antitoxin component YwqK of YwqJK toxin-antitoxin module
MKFIFLTALAAIISLKSLAQQQTFQQGNQTYFVYPFQEKVTYPSRFFKYEIEKQEKITRDSLNRYIIDTQIVPFDFVMKPTSSRSFRKRKKMVYRLRKEYPVALVNHEINMEQDITPSLEPLKDGAYVLFYRDVPYIDNENILRYKNDIVAAKFTLKNNQLDGYAVWFTPQGDTIKHGNFSNGLKEGKWYWYKYTKNESYSRKDEVADYKNGTFQDTTLTIKTYADGLANGPYELYEENYLSEKGNYKNGEAIGEWFEYDFKYDEHNFLIYPFERMVTKHYTLLEKPKSYKGIIIRNELKPGRYDAQNHYISDYEYDLYDMATLSELYWVHYDKEEPGLELPEEKHRSYPGEEHEERYDYEENNEEGISLRRLSKDDKIYLDGKFISRNQLLDSIGYDTYYTGLYEEFYKNGQVRVSLNWTDKGLVEKDTIYWNNGKPMNILSYVPDSNYIIESKYDPYGELVMQNIFNEEGKFLRVGLDKNQRKKHIIEGIPYYTRNDYDLLFRYYNFDTLSSPNLSGNVVLAKNLWTRDTTVSSSTMFNVENRTLESVNYSIDKTLVNKFVVTFSEDYESLAATDLFCYKDWSSEGILSGSYYRSMFSRPTSDTVLTRRVKGYNRNYDISSDYTLRYQNKPFTGTFEFTQNNPTFSLKGDENSLRLNYSTSNKQERRTARSYRKFRKNGKATNNTGILTESVINDDAFGYYVTNNLFEHLYFHFDPVQRRDFMLRSRNRKGDIRSNKVGERRAHAFDKQVIGQYLNGKPNGVWTTYDQHGNILTQVNYQNGELQGKLTRYQFAYPDLTNSQNDIEFMSTKEFLLRDTFPKVATYYQSLTSTFSNGYITGESYEFDWMGDTLSLTTYKEGMKNGFSFERSKIAYTEKSYENGMLDGINRTYLTLPGRDSILLFDLNFQNGQLQGESKAYHTNRKLAKHGFFLSGQPIDDFEAYDTLGLKYQYVKFQYNQPVEEKIWEENQLSVRYTFDWQDSIPFFAEEITNSPSLERLIYKLGFTDEGALKPYMGRPSSVDKTGITYHLTKYYPNDTMARDGAIHEGKKIGKWDFWNLEGRKLYTVNYFDSLIVINDSVKFKSKGVLTYLDSKGTPLSKNYIVEKIEKYDCSHTDHHELRMLYCFWQKDTNQHRINGYVKNYYDNGVLMNEGYVKNGLATGVWKFYDPYGSLNMVGEYVLGKRNGRWLQGDLSAVKYMGDICLNPNLPNLEEIMSYQEKLLDISVVYYRMSAVKKREYYGINMNTKAAPEEEYMLEDDEEYYDDMYEQIEFR